MQNDLKESNIAKNKEFDSAVSIYLIVSAIITVITYFVFKGDYFDGHNFQKPVIILVISVVTTIGLLWYTFSGGECPNCAARKHENRLSQDLVGETYLGKKIEESASKKIGYSNSFDEDYKTYAVFNRTYSYHSVCKYCGYEWTGTFTRREKEKL